MMDWLKDLADPREFMEGLRIDLSGGRVFVFTPKGDVTNLPQGATPVDFAYTIHTEVGHRTIGAKVNGKLVPLDYELRTGDAVEILTSKAQGEGPSQDWLQFVVTPRARNKIRQWFARGRREDALDQGKELLQRQMRKQNLPFKRLATDEVLEQVVADLKYPDLDALYVAVGEGHVSPQSVVARLARSVSGTGDEDVTDDVPLARPVRISETDVSQGVMVKGLPDVWVKLGRCCTPVPGDEIVGFVTRGQGVSVHRADCPNVRRCGASPSGMIEVSWSEGKPTSFVVAIQVEALDRTRLLSDIATVLSDQHVNILSANSTTGPDRITRLRFTFELGRHHAPVVDPGDGEAGRRRLRRLPGGSRLVRVVLQRVARAAVAVDGAEVSSIGSGYLLLVGVGHDDAEADAEGLAAKIAGLRIFRDAEGKTNLDLAPSAARRSSSRSSRCSPTRARAGARRYSAAPTRRGRGARRARSPRRSKRAGCGRPGGLRRRDGGRPGERRARSRSCSTRGALSGAAAAPSPLR